MKHSADFIRDGGTWSSLMSAAQAGYLVAAKKLLAENAKIKATDEYHQYSLMIAAAKDHVDVNPIAARPFASIDTTDIWPDSFDDRRFKRLCGCRQTALESQRERQQH